MQNGLWHCCTQNSHIQQNRDINTTQPTSASLIKSYLAIPKAWFIRLKRGIGTRENIFLQIVSLMNEWTCMPSLIINFSQLWKCMLYAHKQERENIVPKFGKEQLWTSDKRSPVDIFLKGTFGENLGRRAVPFAPWSQFYKAKLLPWLSGPAVSFARKENRHLAHCLWGSSTITLGRCSEGCHVTIPSG